MADKPDIVKKLMKEEKLRKIIKIFIVSILIAISCFLTFYFHVIFETGVVFSHFFYIPAILAALWWKRKGLVVAVFLVAVLIFSHFFIRPNVETVNDLIRASMLIAIPFIVAILSERIAKAQKKTAHLNAILGAIRNVNQLIVREKDRGPLVQGACDHLVEARGYYSAWIALVDENHGFLTAAEAGLGGSFSPIVKMMKRGEFTRCGQKVLKQSDIMVVEDVATACADCPLASTYSSRAGMIVCLEHDARVYGILSVSIPAEITVDADEQLLFGEVAGDIAFALYNMELEKRRERAENELQHLNEKLEWTVEERTKELVKERDHTRHLLESSPDFHVALDRDGKILDVNKAVEKLLGKSHEDMIGISIYEYLPKGETKKVIAKVFERGKVGNAELTVSIPEKGNIILDLSGTVFNTFEGERGVYLSGRDVTERKKAYDTLQESEKRFQDVAVSSADWIWEVDKDGKYTFTSGKVKEILGYEPSELIGKTPFDSMPEDEAKRVGEIFKEIASEKKPIVDLENLNLSKQGEKVNLLTNGVPLLNESGELIGYRGVDKDITKRKRAEEELKESHETLKMINTTLELKVNERTAEVTKLLEQKNEIIHMIGHDLKNPLGPLFILLPMVEGKVEDPKLKEMLQVSIRNVKSLKEMLFKTLEFAKQSELGMKVDFSNICLNENVSNLIESRQVLFTENDIAVENKIDEKIMVNADKLLLNEVFDNLFTNAVKYSQENGGMVTVDALEENDFIKVSVKDTGIGLTEEQLGHIFDKFYKNDDVKHIMDSHGLGLSICKHIVEKHGGKIWAESPGEEKGTTMFFTLPISSEKAVKVESIDKKV